jgi:tetratricopeptide (TPR) repeat protein
LRLNPSFSLAHSCYGLVLSWLGRAQEGADAARRALQLSPRDPFSAISYAVLAYAEFVERNYVESMRMARAAIHQRNDFVGGHRVLTAAAAMAGEIDVAKAALEELRRVQPNISLDWIATQLPFRGEQRDRFLEAMRRAGLE